MRKLTAVVFAFALIAVACGGDGDGDGGRYSSEIRDAYLEGCESEAPTGTFCECTISEIEKKFSEEEFIRFAIDNTEEAPEEFIEIAFACLGELEE